MTKDEFEQQLRALLAPHGIDVVEIDISTDVVKVRASIGGRIAVAQALVGPSSDPAKRVAECLVDLAASQEEPVFVGRGEAR